MYKPVEREAQTLRRYAPEVILGSIAKISSRRRSNPKVFTETLAERNLNHQIALRDYQLAFVAKLLLHFFDKPRLSLREFKWQDLSRACGALAKHQESSSYPLESLEDKNRYIIRIAYQQFPDFYGDNDTFGRTRLLFRTCAGEIEAKVRFDIDRAYEEATGLSFDKSWDITLALFGLIITENKGIYQGPINAGTLKEYVSDSDIDLFVKMTSLTPEEFQEKLKLPEYKLDPYETFNPNPLVNWPMSRYPRASPWHFINQASLDLNPGVPDTLRTSVSFLPLSPL